MIVKEDQLSKMPHLIPCQEDMTTVDIVQLFLHNAWKLYSLPKCIVNDRGLQLESEFWNKVSRTLGVERRLSMGFHLQTDGQIE